MIANAKGRVAVTTFASNVGRMISVAKAAEAAGREVVLVGRAMERVAMIARELGYLDGVREFRSVDTYGYLPRDKVVALITGSQGESRAALARIALDEHPDIALSPGDTVIFSARAIPGNEVGIGRIINALVRQGVEIITDRTHLVHVSGHPRREEMADLLRWVRPRIAVAGAWRGAAHARARRRLPARSGCRRSSGAATATWCGWHRGRPRWSTRCRRRGSTRTARC